ncbi:MAG TPA: SDR family oxidoreductase [Candidatus Saccharimonadales bacterium]|nr:SDR family oxidoreductase [Candidatus Saccharimonadales bacterium]
MADDAATPRNDRKVAVITGASSGIGMATALQFAEKGYDVVLAARRLEELQDVARQCEEKGVSAMPILTDTSSDEAVHDLAREAIDSFGRIDVWINNAGVYLVGKFEELPLKDMQRLMDVNFFGYVHGSHSALEQFKKQGYGTLINVASVNAAAPQPYVSIYSASKAAVRAMDESIRMELRLEGLDKQINVCTVFPAGIDTNLFQNGANYSGHRVRAIEPVYDPTYVAKRIYQLAEKPKREKYVGPVGTLMALQRTHMPGAYEKRVGKFTDVDLLADDPESPTVGNLYTPLPMNRGMRGGWRETRVRADHFNMATGAVLVAAIGLLGYGYYAARKRHGR